MDSAIFVRRQVEPIKRQRESPRLRDGNGYVMSQFTHAHYDFAIRLTDIVADATRMGGFVVGNNAEQIARAERAIRIAYNNAISGMTQMESDWRINGDIAVKVEMTPKRGLRADIMIRYNGSDVCGLDYLLAL